MATTIVSNSTAATFGNSPQKTGEPVDRLSIYSGKALEFDGVSDYMTFPNVYSSLNSDGDLTFAWWMNINNYAPGGTNSKLISSNPGLEITIYSAYARISIGNSNDYNWGGETDTWLRCVFTMRDTVGSLYVNGELKETYTHSSNFKDAKSTTGGFISKRHSTNMTHYIDGKLCDIQFWNTTWSLSDVTYDYLNPEKLITSNASVSGSQTTSNLLVWYPMNDTGITNPQTVVFDGANTGGLETNLVTGVGTSGNWNNLTTADLTNGSATGFTLTSNADGSSNGYLSGNSGILSSNFTTGYYKISLDVAQTTPFGDEQSIRWYKTGSSVELLTLSAGSNVFYRPIDTANNNSQFFFNSNGSGNDITVSNFSIQKVKQGKHATSTFEGDNIVRANTSDGTDTTYYEVYSNNTVAVDSDTIKITYVDSANGALVRLKKTSGALTEDLVVGKQYRLTADIKVNSGSVNWYIVGPGVFLKDGLTDTDFTTYSVDFTAVHETSSYLRVNAMDAGEIAYIDNLTVKEIGIASGWTDANQQQYIPQTSLMDGCVKNIFDGSSSYVDFGSASALDDVFVGGATVSFWAYLDLDNDPTSNGGFIHKIGNGNQGWQIYVDTYSSSKYKFRFTQKWNNEDLIQEAHVLKSQQWNHIVITYDASSNSNRATFYLNGAAQTFDVLSSSYDASDSTSISSDASDNLEIGRKNTSGTYQNMIMDDISIFSTELTESQVIALYNDGLPLNATKSAAASNLVGYWRNNALESTGKWEDLSTNNNHGTPNNLDDYIFFQEGVTANLCTQGYNTNIHHASGGSLHLNGSSLVGSYEANYAELPYDIDIEGDFSVEMWRKLTREFQSNQDGYVLGANNTDFIAIPYAISGGKLHQVYIRQQSGDNKTITMDSSTDGVDLRPSVYEWFHVVLVRESGTYKVYVNGVDLNTGDREVGDSANDFTFRTIAKMTGTGNQAQGFIDDLRIYDKALSAAEANKNYKFGKSKHSN